MKFVSIYRIKEIFVFLSLFVKVNRGPFSYDLFPGVPKFDRFYWVVSFSIIEEIPLEEITYKLK